MEGETVIKVEKVSKVFKLPHEKTTSIKSAIVNFYKRKRTYEQQQALKDISFEIKKGEFFGIVGRNGSGKSTLLKLLAGIYSPTKGIIEVRGSLTPFIELGVGFNHELSGRENVFLNGALLGFSRKEMAKMYNDIVEFAELKRFMDQKLKNYSSGMQVRLAFSIAIRAQSDILLIDEVLAVGDAAFQQKCYEVFAELRKKGTTIVFVTHDMNSVIRFCDRAVLVNNGQIEAIGKPTDIADAYLKLNYEAEPPKKDDLEQANQKDKTKPTIMSVTLKDKKGQKANSFDPGKECSVQIKYANPIKNGIHFGFQIYSETGAYCFGTNTKISGLEPIKISKGEISITTTLDLAPGRYYITVASLNNNATILYNYRSKAAEFRITNKVLQEGVALLDHEWVLS